MKPMSTNVFLQVAKDVKVTRGKIWAVWRMLKCLQPNLWSLSFTRLAVWEWALSCKRMVPSDSIPGVLTLWLIAAPSLSALLCLPPFPMLDEHILHYAHLHSNKETTVWTCVFSLCILCPTLQMAVLICNSSVASFCKECVLWQAFGFHLSARYNCLNSLVII